MGDEHVPFLEGAGIKQKFDALAGCQLALGVLGFNAVGATAHPGFLATAVEFVENVLHGPRCLPLVLSDAIR